MASKSGKKSTTKAGGARRAKKKTSAQTTAESAGGEGSVQESLAATQKQMKTELEKVVRTIRLDIVKFQSQVMEAVEMVHSEQEQGLARVRRAMEGALRQTADRPSGEPAQPTAEEREEGSGDDEEPGDAATPSPVEPVRAIAAGVENVRLAVGHAARAIDEAAPAPEIDASIHEGVASVEKAVHTAAQPGTDATHEGVESVRAAVARETPADTSGAVTRPGDHRHPSR